VHDVVITGLGAITPLGDGVDALWQGLLAGVSAVRRLDGGFGRAGPTLAAVVEDVPVERVLPAKEVPHHDRFIHLALVAMAEALQSARLEPAHAAGEVLVYFGTALGGVESLAAAAAAQSHGARVGPRLLPKVIPNMAAAAVAQHYGLTGPNLTFTTACAASAHALGEAFLALRHGRGQVALVGGAETLFTPVVMDSLDSARALSRRFDDPATACRPFSEGRDGMVMGEGAAALVLETAEHAALRGALPLARVVGYGNCADAYHPVHPHPEGRGAEEAMRRALADAGLSPEAVDYINAHGTATVAGDEAECLAVRRLFPNPPPMSSVKGATGHLMGAAGAVEAVVSVLALQRGRLPPTVNYLGGGPPGIDFVPRPRPADLKVVLSNSFGFGGQNASLVFARAV
jgi:3-oxoacyl-[acyl-carrier-protein] synthase II